VSLIADVVEITELLSIGSTDFVAAGSGKEPA
jgi:hypothetical protein